MKKRTLYTAQQADGVRSLHRVLHGTNWTFEYELPFRTVLDPGVDDLSVAERRRYSEGSFPFVLYPGDGAGYEPALAIELLPDGQLPARLAGDAIVTARFCHDAELPLLRLGADALEPAEEANAFEWVVSRIMAWGREGVQRMADAEEKMREAVDMHPDVSSGEMDDLIGDFDPHFWFDVDHPFPALAAIAQRLRGRFGIRVLPGWFAYEDAGEKAPYELELAREEGGLERTLIGEYETRTAHAIVRRRVGDATRALVDVTGTARFATAHLIVAPDRATAVLDDAYSRLHPGDFWGVATARMQVFDFPWFGGVSPSEVVRDLAQYRAMEAAERWAEKHLPLVAPEVASRSREAK